jgi:hypothetical protein
MNAEEKRIAEEAINYLKTHGLTIDQGWHLNGTPPTDVAEYLDSIIESRFPTDENELTEQVAEMIETELGQASIADASGGDRNEALRERVFQLVCDNWTKEAAFIAADAFEDRLSSDLPVGDLLRPVIGRDSGFWLDQLARACFDLPAGDWDGEDWGSLLEEIANRPNKRASGSPQG